MNRWENSYTETNRCFGEIYEVLEVSGSATKKIELLVLLLALAGIYTVSRNLEKYVQSDQVKSEQERKMDLVVIDSGHGGSDPGKVGINEVLEKISTLRFQNKWKKN